LDTFYHHARGPKTYVLIALVTVFAWGRDIRLTLGLMGLDELHLRVLSASSDDEVERKNAAKGVRETPRDRAVEYS
jgi:hypothetical protein